MATRLTPEQHADLEQHGRKPMQVIDPIDQKVYFIVPGDFFEKFGIPIDLESFDVRETYAAQDAALAKVWDDSALDVYNDYDSNKPGT